MENEKNETLIERLHRTAKYYNISYPALYELLIEAVDELESETRWANHYSTEVEKLTNKVARYEEVFKNMITFCEDPANRRALSASAMCRFLDGVRASIVEDVL